MDTQQERQAIEALLNGYAEAITAGNGNLIPGYYSQAAIFMPEGRKTLSRNDLERDKTNLFKKTAYSIGFSVQNITIDGSYAFVEATAQTTTTVLESGDRSAKASQDLFVLSKELNDWKIFRYMFNNVKEQ